MAGGTDRGIQRCSVFSTLGSDHSGLSIFVLVTVAALPCIACTSGQLGFALFQVPQLSFPSPLVPSNKSGCFHQHPLSFGNRRIVWPSGSHSFHPPSFINSHDKFHTFSSLFLFFTDHAPIPGLHVLRTCFVILCLVPLLLLHSEISSPFLTCLPFPLQPYLFKFQHFHETAPHTFLPRPFQFLKVNFECVGPMQVASPLLNACTPT